MDASWGALMPGTFDVHEIPVAKALAEQIDRELMARANGEDPVHEYFALSYCGFVVLHRSIMQSMPVEWQREMVRLLRQADEAASDLPGMPDRFSLMARDQKGRIVRDPYLDYERGRRRVELRPITPEVR